MFIVHLYDHYYTRIALLFHNYFELNLLFIILPFEIEHILNIPIDSDEEYADLSDDETFDIPVSIYFTFNVTTDYKY